tara:strand:+ start:3864 stop:4925 length:1062 start_codon:yes stop_codon:yes gene_type:complete
MNKYLLSFIFLLFFSNSSFSEIKLTKLLDQLNSPWSLTIVEEQTYLITEKSGNLVLFNKAKNIKKNIKHNLSVLEDGQGGLLDAVYHSGYIYVSYSEDRGGGKSSTSAARAKFNKDKLNFVNIFQANPPINSGYHFGSRLVIKGKHLYISVGERGEGIIAQDPNKHPGSIIRIYLDGTIPKDNPKFKGKNNWLPEIYQIGIRNVQGMALSPMDNEVYMTNHGARGGDWFGKVNFAGNYGWDILYWGGTKYSGLKGGPKWLPGFDKPIKYYVPSIATSACLIYKGKEFPEWNGHALIASLRDQSLRKIIFQKGSFQEEKIIFKNKIGRIRDVKQDKDGKILLLTDQGFLWSMKK